MLTDFSFCYNVLPYHYAFNPDLFVSTETIRVWCSIRPVIVSERWRGKRYHSKTVTTKLFFSGDIDKQRQALETFSLKRSSDENDNRRTREVIIRFILSSRQEGKPKDKEILIIYFLIGNFLVKSSIRSSSHCNGSNLYIPCQRSLRESVPRD